jgi:hypothetical protein
MADANLPAPWCPRNEIVAHDRGGWISGAGIDPALSGAAADTEPVPADDIHQDDVIIVDGMLAVVERRRDGHYWLAEGFSPGVMLEWKLLYGSARGTMFRPAADLLLRVRDSN